MTKKLWISEATPEEQGSFCDTGSQHHYDNTSDFGKTVAASAAEEGGTEVMRVDEPFDGSLPAKPYDSDQRFNLFYAEDDSMDIPSPTKYSPGR